MMFRSQPPIPPGTGQSRRGALRVLGTGLLALPMAGCSGLLPQPAPPPRLFQLRAPGPGILAAHLPATNTANRRLLIDLPDAAYGLATQRIVLTRGAYGLDYFADAAWQDKAPALIQSLLIESFENTGRLAAVGRGAVPWQPDYVLESNILDFEAAYDDAMDTPRIVLRLAVRLVRSRDRSVMAHLDLTETAQAAHNTVDSVIAAFDAAFGTLAQRLTAWALGAMAAP
jgi:cholesterol transport system auxiliary component